MTRWWQDAGQMLAQWWWLLELALVVVGMLVAMRLVRHLVRLLQKGVARSAGIWDDALLQAARRPLHLFIWFFGLILIAQIVLEDHADAAWLPQVRLTGILLILGWFLIALIRSYTAMACERRRRTGDLGEIDMYVTLSKILQAGVIVVLGITVLQTFGVGISGILTFGGIGGLIVGFAAKDLLENFFGGLMLHMDRPFKTGDWIRSPDRNLEGTVEKIGWRQTLIRTHSKNAIYIPNGLFLTIVIENPGQMSHRMIKEAIGLRYEDLGKMRGILKDVEELLRDSEKFDQDMPLLVRFDRFNDSSVDFFVQCYTRTITRPEYTRIKEELLFAVADVVARHGADIAYPTQTMLVKQEPAPGPAQDDTTH